MRTIASRVARAVASRTFLGTGITLLAMSAVLGNVAQYQDRDRAEDRIEHLRADIAAAKAETAEVKAQLAQVTGEQECRARIAAQAEVHAGQLQVGISEFVIAVNARDLAAIEAAVERLRSTAPLLVDALARQQGSVNECSRNTP